MRKVLFSTVAVLALSAVPALAGGPPPWAGQPGGPGNAGAFDGWAGGSVMSGSANEFGFEAAYRDVGAFAGGVAAAGFNAGSASVGANFSADGFNAWADSANVGGAIGGGFGLGRGNRHSFDMNVGSFGQSFGEVNYDFGN